MRKIESIDCLPLLIMREETKNTRRKAKDRFQVLIDNKTATAELIGKTAMLVEKQTRTINKINRELRRRGRGE